MTLPEGDLTAWSKDSDVSARTLQQSGLAISGQILHSNENECRIQMTFHTAPVTLVQNARSSPM